MALIYGVHYTYTRTRPFCGGPYCSRVSDYHVNFARNNNRFPAYYCLEHLLIAAEALMGYEPCL